MFSLGIIVGRLRQSHFSLRTTLSWPKGQYRLGTLYILTVEESTILVSLIALLASRGNFCSSPSKSISSTTSKDLGLPPRACGATPIRLLKSLEKKKDVWWNLVILYYLQLLLMSKMFYGDTPIEDRTSYFARKFLPMS